VITAFVTLIVVGALFLVSQFVAEGVIKPYVEYRKVLAEISYNLIYFAHIIISEPAHWKRDEQAEISERLRQLSARLRAAVTALPFHQLMRALRLIPPQAHIYDAAARLVRMSTLLLEVEHKRHDEIRQDMAAIGSVLQIDVAREK
jgi:hypothetical protein